MSWENKHVFRVGTASQFISTLIMRINAIISDTRMNDVINPEQPVTLSDWLENHIGSNNGVTACNFKRLA